MDAPDKTPPEVEVGVTLVADGVMLAAGAELAAGAGAAILTEPTD